MTIKSAAVLVGIAFFGLTACNKYEDGPKISLRSKKERVANTWVIEKAIRNGNDVTDEYTIYTLTTSKDGDAKLNAAVTGSFTYTTDGTWEFNSNKENLIFDYENNNADNTYQILKLKEDELWIREVGGEDELHLQPG